MRAKHVVWIAVVLLSFVICLYFHNRTSRESEYQEPGRVTRQSASSSNKALEPGVDKKAERLPIPQRKPEVDSPSIHAKQVRDLLRSLSLLASDIDAGIISLADARANRQQPDATMWRLRVLAHGDPKVIPLLLEFMRNTEEPIAARILLMMALAVPQNEDLVKFTSAMIGDPPDPRLGVAAFLSFNAGASKGIGRAWNLLFEYLTVLDLPEGYKRPWPGFAFIPSDAREYPTLSRSWIRDSDLSDLATSVVSLLGRSDFGAIRSLVMGGAEAIIARSEVSNEVRERFNAIVEDSFVNTDLAWRSAFDILINRHRLDRPVDVDLIGRGISSKDAEGRVAILDEVARVNPAALFQAPFRECLTGCMEVLGREPREGEPWEATYTGLCWSLVVHSPDDGWSRDALAGHPSVVLRRRISSALNMPSRLAELPSTHVHRVLEMSRTMMRDTDSQVSVRAASTLVALLENSRSALTPGEFVSLQEQVTNWLEVRGRGVLKAGEAAYLKTIGDRLKRVRLLGHSSP